MLSQLTLRFPKKLIDALKNRAANEKTSVNALAERFLDMSLQSAVPDDDWLRLISQPDDTLRQLYRKIILGETFGRQTIRRSELRFMVEMAHQAYSRGSQREWVRLPVLVTLLNITFELLHWQAEKGLPVDHHYIQQTFEFETENWPDESARFLCELSPAVSPGYAELLLRPLASGCFTLTDFPDEVLARIFTPARLQQIFPLLMSTREWSVKQREAFIREMRPLIPELSDTFTAGDLRFDLRVEGQRAGMPPGLGDEIPRLYLMVSGPHFVVPFDWAYFAELSRLLTVYCAAPEALRQLSEGYHVSLLLPGAASKDVILGFDALRVFVPAEAFEVLARELTAREETGPLSDALAGLRTLYGDL
ncbi:transcriptional regulator [Yersinia enterocolitica]|uniref:transcriptional regulator n=1 Tax=Yersinia enterocolitica TaxID=630 RepID=UPI003CFCB785